MFNIKVLSLSINMLHYFVWVVGKCAFDTFILLNFKLRKSWENLFMKWSVLY